MGSNIKRGRREQGEGEKGSKENRTYALTGNTKCDFF
jgi:hypothetical protein